MSHPMSLHVRKCIDACQRCHNQCVQALMTRVLEKENPVSPLDPTLARTLMDCAEACSVASGFMLRHSPYHDRACHLCLILCNACALACNQAGGMADCLHACQRCAESCAQMAETMLVATD